MLLGAAHTNGLYTVPAASGTQFADGVAKIKELGLPVLKVYCTPDYALNYPLETAFSSTPTTCKELLQTTEFSTALADSHWQRVIFTTFTFANNPGGVTNWWRLGPTNAQLEAEYDEIYEMTEHLLTTYNDSGKDLILQNWEGDWSYLDAFSPTTRNLRRYTEFYSAFLGARQRAVSDAMRDTAHINVSVRHAIEVNRVLDAVAQPHLPRMLTSIAERVTPDIVSYSAYDSTIADYGWAANHATWTANCETYFPKALRAIKRAWPGVPMQIGEFGYPENEAEFDHTPSRPVDEMIQTTYDIALDEGVETFIYWEVFDNETHGTYTYRGYWLFDNLGTKTVAGTKMEALAL